MTKSLQVLPGEIKKEWADLALNFEAFASDIFEQLSKMSDGELSEAGVSVLKTEISDKSSNINSIKFSFFYNGTTFTLEKRKPIFAALWPNETIIGCCCPESGGDYSFESFKNLVCSETVQVGPNYSIKQHINEYFRMRALNNESVIVRVSPLHSIEGNVDDFCFKLKVGEIESEDNTFRGALPDDEFYGYSSVNFLDTCNLGKNAFENMRDGWEIVYNKLGLVLSPYGKTLGPS